MKSIECHLRRDGFDLLQIARLGMWAVYEQSKGGRVTSYELVRIKVAKPSRVFDRDYPARELYPANGEWGVDGFTVNDRNEAIHRTAQISSDVPNTSSSSSLPSVLSA